MIESANILGAAFVLDALLGDPSYRCHPVRLIGMVANTLESLFFRFRANGFFGGAGFFFITMTVVVGMSGFIRFGLSQMHPALVVVFDIYMLYSCISVRDLKDHALPISEALERDDIVAARAKVQRIVGRDASVLDAHGVARAAVESVSESFVDGFFAPIFWFGAGTVAAQTTGIDAATIGLLCAVIYRTTNTLDSMVGYRNERYQRFGFVSAKADDAFNFVPARLAVTSLFPAALCCRLASTEGLRIWFRDRLKSPSPNAAHAESFAAGALGLKLSGPVTYSFGVCDKPWIGRGTPDASSVHVRKCARLVWVAAAISIVLETALLWLS